MPLQGSGPISIFDIQTELNITPGTPQSVAGGSTPQPGSLFGEANGAINRVAPHNISEFYGYTQVTQFGASPTGYATAGGACGDTDVGTSLWHNGTNDYPEVGDDVFVDISGSPGGAFNGGDDWWRIPAEGTTVQIDALGVVTDKELCNQTLLVSPQFSVVDEDAQIVTVTITSNTSWNLITNQSWATWDSNGLQTISGSGNATLTLDLAVNSGSSTRTVRIDGTYALGTVQPEIDQLSTPFITTNNIGYSTVGSVDSCTLSSSTVLTDTGNISTATYIGNAITQEPAAAGFYSDGAAWKEWNGFAVVGTGIC